MSPQTFESSLIRPTPLLLARITSFQEPSRFSYYMDGAEIEEYSQYIDAKWRTSAISCPQCGRTATFQDDETVAPPTPSTTEVKPSSSLVTWDGPNDPQHPMNWSSKRKWAVVIVLSWITFCVSFSSSIFSTAIRPTSIEFHVSEEVMILGVSLFVLGFAVGKRDLPDNPWLRLQIPEILENLRLTMISA